MKDDDGLSMMMVADMKDSSDSSLVLKKGKYKFWALAAFWSMFTGTVMLRWSARNLNHFSGIIDSPIHNYLDVLVILLKQPRVISTNVGHAWDLPPNTFGAAYAKFMGSRNYSPDDRPPVRFIETDELAYVAMTAREVHDLWHTLFDLPTNLMGESALKIIEFQQMYLPMCLMSAIGGSVRFNEKQRKLFFQHYFPWALRAGTQSTYLMCIYYEKHFHEDLEDVRRKWGITPASAAPK